MINSVTDIQADGDNDWQFGGNGDDTLSGRGSEMVGGAGDDLLNGGASEAELFVYEAESIGFADVAAGDADTITGVGTNDALAITSVLAAELTSSSDATSAGLDDGEVLGSVIDGNNNIAFNDASDLLMIDTSADGTFNAEEDFSITLVGVATVTHLAGPSWFTFTLDI